MFWIAIGILCGIGIGVVKYLETKHRQWLLLVVAAIVMGIVVEHGDMDRLEDIPSAASNTFSRLW